MSDLGQKVTFKGPGHWRSHAVAAQEGTRPPAAALDPRVPAKGVASRGLDWPEAEYELTREEHWDAKLHPRGPAGKFAHTAGGGTVHEVPGTPVTADSGKGSIETRQVAALAHASGATERALSERMSALDTVHRAELTRLTAELRVMQQDLADASKDEKKAEEKHKSIGKFIHQFLALAITGIALFFANKYEMGVGAEIAGTVGPLALQGILDLVRKV
jgi:hypothetical protein